MKTCDQCSHFSPEEFFDYYQGGGDCELFGDWNDIDFNKMDMKNDICYGADAESYRARVIVMPKFGCIHWEGK